MAPVAAQLMEAMASANVVRRDAVCRRRMRPRCACRRYQNWIAVALAPAIHDTDTLPLDEVMARLRDLVARVRAGRCRGSELSDPTITLTSLGDRGVDLVMPVIYPPQVAIVGLGTPRPRPWVVDGAVVPRPVIEASMAGDHRVSDGHRGGLLLATWTDMLQQPEAL